MSKTNARYPQPLDNVVVELAQHFGVNRYQLELHAILKYVIEACQIEDRAPETPRLQQMLYKMEMSNPDLPACHFVQVELPKAK